MKISWVFIISILSLIVTSGCTMNRVSNDQSQSFVAASPQQSTTQLGFSPQTLEATMGLSSATAAAVATATPSPTSAFNPLELPPTVAPNQAFDILLNQIPEASECSLPCVWGISPGISTLDILYERILPLGQAYSAQYDEATLRFEVYIPVPHSIESSGSILALFLVDENVITEIFMGYDYTRFYGTEPWNEILRPFGPPDEIFLFGISGPSRSSPVDYSFGLFYSEAGLYLSFSGVVNQGENRNYWICPLLQAQDFIAVTAWDPGNEIASERVRNRAIERFLSPVEMYDTDMTIDSFYEDIILGEDENACFEVRANEN